MKTTRTPSIFILLAFATILVFLGDVCAREVAQGDETSVPARQLLSLDGDWEIVFDPGNTGRQAGWQQKDV